MKILKYLLIAFIGLIVILVVIGFLLPGSYHVERIIVIKGKTSEIYPYIGTLTKWPEWTVWNKTKYPEMVSQNSDLASGVGGWSTWKNRDGEGKTTITKADPEKGIVFDLSFNKGEHLSVGEIRTETQGESVKVTWTNEGNLGLNPIGRYFGLLMDKFMGPDFQTGLENLKAKIEKR
ncbi:MAG: SRPBCC family protein [Planctomycetota bacterium]